MRSTQILDQGGDGKPVGVIIVTIAIDGEVDDREKCVGVNILILAYFPHCLVAKSEAYAK